MLGWDKLHIRRAKQKAKMMFKVVNSQVRRYMHEIFTKRVSHHETQTTNWLCLSREQITLTTHSGYSGALLWNNLPGEVRNAERLASFEKGIQKHFLETGSPTANM